MTDERERTEPRQVESATSFHERLDEFVGKPVGPSSSSRAPDPVNQPMIRHWAAAFEDHNPTYTDPERAARSRFGGIVAPPLMLQTWTMATPTITGIAERGGSPVESEGVGALAMLDEAGFVGTLASNSEFEIQRYLHLGEVVSSNAVMESISHEKKTRLGPGHFVTWVTTFLDELGAVVGQQRFRVFKFRPIAAKSEQATRSGVATSDRLAGGDATHVPRQQAGRESVPAADAVVATAPASVDWHQIHVGDELPPLEVNVTATVIVAGAMATRDFMPVHHDRDYANAQGAPDIFMNIISSNAYCSRFLTDWAGPDAMARRVSIRLGVPVFPGSTLIFTGRVTAMSRDGDEGTIEVEVRATTQLGDHLTGSATVGLPANGEPKTDVGAGSVDLTPRRGHDS